MAGGGQAPGVHHSRQRSVTHTVDLYASSGDAGWTHTPRDRGDVVGDDRHDRVVHYDVQLNTLTAWDQRCLAIALLKTRN